MAAAAAPEADPHVVVKPPDAQPDVPLEEEKKKKTRKAAAPRTGKAGEGAEQVKTAAVEPEQEKLVKVDRRGKDLPEESREEVRRECLALVMEYDASKHGEIAELLEKHQGKENQILDKLKKKWKVAKEGTHAL